MGASSMPGDPIQSGEFNAALQGIRDQLSRMEKKSDATDRRIDDLFALHRDCADRREKEAYQRGMEAGKVKTLVNDVNELREDKKTSITFRRWFIATAALSLLASLFPLLSAWFRPRS